MSTTFTYDGEADKAFGITGMVICLNVCDEEHALQSVSLDAGPDDEAFTIASEYMEPFESTPAAAWHASVDRFGVLCSLASANVLCRFIAYRNRAITNSLSAELRDLVAPAGREFCSLADDEINSIFTRSMGQMLRVFREPRVLAIASRYAEALRRRRALSRAEAFELLQSML